jgi:predicted anti-sigma-YlaC factor YlaD
VDSALRLALLAVGGGQLALALPPLVAGAATMSAPVHVAHESGAWNLAVAIAFFAVGVLPRLAAGALPMLGSFTVVLWWVTLDDLGAGHVYSHRALGHVLLLIGALLVAVLAWRGRRRTGALTTARSRVRQLHPGARSDLSSYRVRP